MWGGLQRWGEGHRAPLQAPAVPAWAHEIAFQVAVAMEEWESASWSPWCFISPWELIEANVCGEKPPKAGKLSCRSYCPQPLVPSQAGSRCGPWRETSSFAAPRHNPTSSSLSKGRGTNGRSSRALSKPGPSQGCGEALGFLASGHAVIPLI